MTDMAESTRLKFLRIVLIFSGIAWGASVFGIFLPWENAETLLEGLGVAYVEYDPMLDYWLRMAAGAFTLVGVIYFIFAAKPLRYATAIPLFGWLMLLEGVILLAHGLRLHLHPFPFIADTTACFLGGGAIIFLSKQRSSTKS